MNVADQAPSHPDEIDHMKFTLDSASMRRELADVKEGQKAVLGFFMFLALALLWIGNGVLMDPLWQTTKVGNKHVMTLRKETQVAMIKMFSIVYWIFFAMSIVMTGLSLDKAPRESPFFLVGMFYLCLAVLGVVGMVGAGYLTAKVWKAPEDPTNKDRVLLTFTRAQLTTVKILCVLMWADIVFAAMLFIWKTYNLK